MRFTEKVVIVTGAGSGIGQAIAIAFAKEGATLVLASRSIEKCDTSRQIQDLGRRALAIKTDVGVQEQVEAMVNKAVQEFGRIDVLVNNAWWMNFVPAELSDMEPEAVEAQTNTFKGYINTVRAVLPHMKEKKYGRIINITSIGGKIKNPMWPVYGALKAGVAHFTRCACEVLARDGITINCVGPGLINDNATKQVFTEEGTAGMAAMIPVGRIGELKDITRAVLFMADDEAGFITGQELTVCGGQSPY